MNAANIASSAWHPTEISVDNVEYCLENTQTADHNVWAYTTQVLFKVIYSPKGLIDPDKNVYNNPADNVNNGELLPGTDWLMVNGGYYTWNLLMDYIKAERCINTLARIKIRLLSIRCIIQNVEFVFEGYWDSGGID